jgi:hypothetical protein
MKEAEAAAAAADVQCDLHSSSQDIRPHWSMNAIDSSNALASSADIGLVPINQSKLLPIRLNYAEQNPTRNSASRMLRLRRTFREPERALRVRGRSTPGRRAAPNPCRRRIAARPSFGTVWLRGRHQDGPSSAGLLRAARKAPGDSTPNKFRDPRRKNTFRATVSQTFTPPPASHSPARCPPPPRPASARSFRTRGRCDTPGRSSSSLWRPARP